MLVKYYIFEFFLLRKQNVLNIRWPHEMCFNEMLYIDKDKHLFFGDL